MKSLSFYLATCLFVISATVWAEDEHRVALPDDYRNTFAKFPMVNREMNPDQLGVLYANSAALTGIATGEFPSGSVMLFEIYKAEIDADGNVLTGADGMRQPAGHALTAVMEKRDGWGADIPEAIRNGDWDYSTYKPDGTFAKKDFAACFACHLPLGEEVDFVFDNAWAGLK